MMVIIFRFVRVDIMPRLILMLMLFTITCRGEGRKTDVSACHQELLQIQEAVHDLVNYFQEKEADINLILGNLNKILISNTLSNNSKEERTTSTSQIPPDDEDFSVEGSADDEGSGSPGSGTEEIRTSIMGLSVTSFNPEERQSTSGPTVPGTLPENHDKEKINIVGLRLHGTPSLESEVSETNPEMDGSGFEFENEGIETHLENGTIGNVNVMGISIEKPEVEFSGSTHVEIDGTGGPESIDVNEGSGDSESLDGSGGSGLNDGSGGSGFIDGSGGSGSGMRVGFFDDEDLY